MGIPLTASGARTRGRPRSSDADRSILAAARELMTEMSYGAFSMAQLASRAGVSSATLYRRFRNKDDVIAAVLADHKAIPDVDTGSLEGDLYALADTMRTRLMSGDGRLLQSVLGEVPQNARVAELVSQRVRSPSVDDVRSILRRALARGETPELGDPRLVREVVVGALLRRCLFTGEPLSPEFVRRLVALIVAGLRRP